jgi:hypothetical protein
MKVKKWVELETETEIEISLDDVLSEFADRVDYGTDAPRLLLASLDSLTKILAVVKDDWIKNMKLEARLELQKRLSLQAARYED